MIEPEVREWSTPITAQERDFMRVVGSSIALLGDSVGMTRALDLASLWVADLRAAVLAVEPEQRPSFVREPIPALLRRLVFERDGYRCVRCGDWHELQIDHVVPVSRGGATETWNLRTFCGPCNRAKSDRLDGETA